MQGFPSDEQQLKMRDRIKVQQVGPRKCSDPDFCIFLTADFCIFLTTSADPLVQACGRGRGVPDLHAAQRTAEHRAVERVCGGSGV
jgi:hypothetical protein